MDYPERENWFASKYQKFLIRCGVLHELGSDGFALLSVVCQMEDTKRYSEPVTFWNDQLTDRTGWSESKLNRVRKICVEEGWLIYQPGGKSKVGKYFVNLPLNNLKLRGLGLGF